MSRDISVLLGPGFRRDDGMMRSALIANRGKINAPIPERAHFGAFGM
jgi:hypothetical protein